MTQTTGRRAIVCGCASGIGAEGVRALADDGWRLALLDRDDAVHDVAAKIGAESATVVDARDPGALEAAAQAAVQQFGGLDALWSNAGVQFKGGVEDATTDEWDASWAVNVRSHAVLAQVGVPAMRGSGGGSILITSSNSGLLSEPQMLCYTVTKSAAIALAKCLASEHAVDQIRVNALCPGYVDTAFNTPIWSKVGGRDAFLEQIGTTIPLGRMASAREIGRLAAWLLSDERASYITGQTITADGGEVLGFGGQ